MSRIMRVLFLTSFMFLFAINYVSAATSYSGNLGFTYQSGTTTTDGKLKVFTAGYSGGPPFTTRGFVYFVKGNTGKQLLVSIEFAPTLNSKLNNVTTRKFETVISDVGTDEVSLFSYYIYGDTFSSITSISASYIIKEVTPPDNPTVSVYTKSDNSITLDLSSVGATSYKIYRDRTAVGTVTGSNRFTDTGLQPDTDYQYYIEAINDMGSSFSPQITVKTLTKPKNVSISVKGAVLNGVTLSFAADYASNIHVFKNGTKIKSLTGADTAYLDNAVTPSTTYQYWVVAENAYGTTASSIISVTTPDPPPPPNSVSITLDKVAHDSVSLKFQANGAETIRLYRDGSLLKTFTGSITGYSDTTVLDDTSYQYWIVAENNSGNTASSIITVKTNKYPLPSGVTIQGNGTKTAITLNFQASWATSIKVFRDGIELTSLSGTATNYTDTSVTQNGTYKYWIVASNKTGNTASSIITISTLQPGKIVNLHITDKTTNSVKFAWNAESTAQKYIIDIVVTHAQTTSLVLAASPPPTTTTTLETTTNEVTVSNLAKGDQVKTSVSVYNSDFGKHGTANISYLVPVIDVPTYPQSPPSMITPVDVFESGASLASIFWPFVLLGLSFIVAWWIIALKTKAVKAPAPGNPRREERETKRHIRLELRKDVK